MRDIPRITTILQSLDTVRYRDADFDGPEAEVVAGLARSDLAHARSEILGAMVFGHEIVVPAGVVADCPTFRHLLPEIMDGAESIRSRADSRLGRRYHPLRIGVEQQFTVEEDGRRDYDAFAHDFLGAFNPDHTQLAEIRRIAASSKNPDDFTLAIVGNAYLSRDFDAIDGLDRSFGKHCRAIQAEFGSDSETAAPAIVAPSGTFTKGDGVAYERVIADCCGRAQRTPHGFNEHALVEAKAAEIIRIGREIEVAEKRTLADRPGGDPSKAHNPAGTRGFWYRKAEEFGDAWPFVSNWLDRALYDRLVQSYDVALPSFFTQPVEATDRARDLSLVYLDKSDILRFSARTPTSRVLPPAPDEVPWQQVWEFVTRPDVDKLTMQFQERLCALRDKGLGIRKKRVRDERDGVRDTVGLYELSARTLKRDIGELVQRHMGDLGKLDSTIKFAERSGRISVGFGREPTPLGSKGHLAVNVGLGVLVGLAGQAIFGDPAGVAAVLGAMFAPPVAEEIITPPVKWAIDAVRAPPRRTRELKQQFTAAEVERYSYWITPE